MELQVEEWESEVIAILRVESWMNVCNKCFDMVSLARLVLGPLAIRYKRMISLMCLCSMMASSIRRVVEDSGLALSRVLPRDGVYYLLL